MLQSAAHWTVALIGFRFAYASFLFASEPSYSWRYYRPTNMGIQGDFCNGLWSGRDNDPWIG